MKLINLTYPTYLEEIKQELAVNSFFEGLHDSETSQKISEALAYTLQVKIAKQISRNQERIIRRVKVSRDYRKTNEKIFMRLMRQMQTFLNEGKTHDNKNTTFRSSVVRSVAKRGIYKATVLAILVLMEALVAISFILLI